jgi:hypothetical protein
MSNMHGSVLGQSVSVRQQPATGSWLQLPVEGSQESIVQSLPSRHGFCVPVHTPAAQWSSRVHGLPSSHPLLSSGVKVHCPVDESQVSSVHGLLSSQTTVALVSHAPLVTLQASVVQALASSHVVVWLVSQAPLDVLHASVVQALASSHVVVWVVWQAPVDTLHDSVVQAF